MTTPYRKKMIEVAIPLDTINRESALRKRKAPAGYPTTLHKWWAQRPLAACRAVLFTSLIDDPGEEGVPKELLALIDELPPPPGAAEADTITETRRKKLFAFIGELVKWESTTDETIIGKARELILAATGGNPPPVLDPFCGGGSIPLEAQRLGLQAYASDLNPVAVLITKALVEIPPKFAGKPPVNPNDRERSGAIAPWKGASGLAADVRYYGKWMRDRALERIGHLYPNGPNGETVIAWLWARTVRCPNPVCGAEMPLVKSFWLSTNKTKGAWLEPEPDKESGKVRFQIRNGVPQDASRLNSGTKVGGSEFRCAICQQIAAGQHIKAEGMAGRMSTQLLACVVAGSGSRSYLGADSIADIVPDDQLLAQLAGARGGFLAGSTPARLTGGTCYGYGLTTWGSLFTDRQLVALLTFADLVAEVLDLIRVDIASSKLKEGEPYAEHYAAAVATYLAFAMDRAADYGSTLTSWRAKDNALRSTFSKQSLPMVWDFAEANPFATSSGGFVECCNVISRCLAITGEGTAPTVRQLDAAASINGTPFSAIASDPPYYKNISYADLSDYFYVWLRRSLGGVYPTLFSTMMTPKDQELVAASYRFAGGQAAADEHFEAGLTKAFKLVNERASTEIPMTLYYAFKETETRKDGGVSSSGWEKLLASLMTCGFQVVATWPFRTEGDNRQVGIGTNALASAVVLACRPRPLQAPLATLREFQVALRTELPRALRVIKDASVAAVDRSQAAIGPGMAVFSRYSRVIEPNGEPMSVRRALELINAAIEEYDNEIDGSFDPTTRFCLRVFEQQRFGEGRYGEVAVIARGQNVGIDTLDRAGVLKSGAGKVMLWGLMHYQDQIAGYDPALDTRLSAWEACHYLAAALRSGGEGEAAKLARRLGGVAETARDLAYRLYSICERKKWSEEARPYNELVASWPEIQKRAAALSGETQGTMS